jgi:hypothetical protein
MVSPGISRLRTPLASVSKRRSISERLDQLNAVHLFNDVDAAKVRPDAENFVRTGKQDWQTGKKNRVGDEATSLTDYHETRKNERPREPRTIVIRAQRCTPCALITRATHPRDQLFLVAVPVDAVDFFLVDFFAFLVFFVVLVLPASWATAKLAGVIARETPRMMFRIFFMFFVSC